MRGIKCLAVPLGAVLWISASMGVARAAPGDTQLSVWEHHEASTAFFGQTSVFTCSGIEAAVKQVLLYLGARADLEVHASCPDPVRPVATAFVKTAFYSLQPAPSGASNTVSGQWVPIELAPQRPRFMGRSECELVDQFKALLTKDFSFRDLNYRALCFPHEVTALDYEVHGQVLKPQAQK